MNFIDRIQKLYQDPQYRREQAFLGGGVAFGTIMTGGSLGTALLGVGLTMAGATLLKSKWDEILERKKKRDLESRMETKNGLYEIVEKFSRATNVDEIREASKYAATHVSSIKIKPTDIAILREALRVTEQAETITIRDRWDIGADKVNDTKRSLYELQETFKGHIKGLKLYAEPPSKDELWRHAWNRSLSVFEQMAEQPVKNPLEMIKNATVAMNHYQTYLMHTPARMDDIENINKLRKALHISERNLPVSRFDASMQGHFLTLGIQRESFVHQSKTNLWKEGVYNARPSTISYNTEDPAKARLFEYGELTRDLLELKVLQKLYPIEQGNAIIKAEEERLEQFKSSIVLHSLDEDKNFNHKSYLDDNAEVYQKLLQEAQDSNTEHSLKLAVNAMSGRLHFYVGHREQFHLDPNEDPKYNPANLTPPLLDMVQRLEALKGETPQTATIKAYCEIIQQTYAPQLQQENTKTLSSSELSM